MRLPAALLLLTALCGTAVAAASGAVVERRQTMKSFAVAARTISEMFAGKRAYDSGEFRAAAELIRQGSGARLREDFPAGSLGDGSQAKPEIFAEWGEFTVRSDQLALLAAGLVQAAERSPDAIGSDMRMGKPMPMGGSLLGSREKPLTEAEIAGLPAEHVFHLMIEQCTACHAKFRVPEN